jgi:hypothetical protein
MKRIGIALIGLLFAVCYGTAGFFMYRARRIYHDPTWMSDFLIFVLPFVMAAASISLISYFCLPSGWRIKARLLSALAIGLTIAFLTMWVYMVVAINEFGA